MFGHDRERWANGIEVKHACIMTARQAGDRNQKIAYKTCREFFIFRFFPSSNTTTNFSLFFFWNFNRISWVWCVCLCLCWPGEVKSNWMNSSSFTFWLMKKIGQSNLKIAWIRLACVSQNYEERKEDEEESTRMGASFSLSLAFVWLLVMKRNEKNCSYEEAVARADCYFIDFIIVSILPHDANIYKRSRHGTPLPLAFVQPCKWHSTAHTRAHTPQCTWSMSRHFLSPSLVTACNKFHSFRLCFVHFVVLPQCRLSVRTRGGLLYMRTEQLHIKITTY